MVSVLVFFALAYVGCVNDPVGNGSPVDPPPDQFEAGITLASRSGNTGPLLAMTESLPPAGGYSGPVGEWTTTTDSTGISTVFVVARSGAGTVVHSGSGADSTVVLLESEGSPLVVPELVMMTDAVLFSVDKGYPIVADYSGAETQDARAGLLTAGEWNDHVHWDDFRTFIREYPDHFSRWQLNLQKRVMIRVVDAGENPVPGAQILISRDGVPCFEGQSLGDGCVAFFPLDRQENGDKYYEVRARGPEYDYYGTFLPVEDDDQLWVIKLERQVTVDRPTLDLVFTVDVTGSMGDELEYVKSELLDICEKVYAAGIDGLRVGFTFYRDRGDEFVTRVFPFTADAAGAKENIATMRSAGGGDGPESMNLALKQTLRQLEWRTDRNCMRLCFLVADAPPHYYSDEQYVYTDALHEAVRKGIKIIPVAGSGIRKADEYLLRHMAVQTMGKYIFITGDSGIGGSHIDPDVGQYDVETLNDIIVRTILEEAKNRTNG